MSRRHIAFVAAVAALVLASAAAAAKPGAGSEAPARVFWVNPVQSLRDESLTDQNDAGTAVPETAYREVTLTHLDGSGYLQATTSRSATRSARRPTRPATEARSVTRATRTSSSR